MSKGFESTAFITFTYAIFAEYRLHINILYIQWK